VTKNILLTGGSRGLGISIVETLLKNDWGVFVVNREWSDGLRELDRKYPGKVTVKPFDLSETERIKKVIFNDFLPLDIRIDGFVNNAARAYDDLVTNLDTARLESMFRVNVFSPMVLTKYVIRNMLYHAVRGSIVHISSISVHTGYKGLAMYASTKGALEAFSKNTAREWGRKGIRSNCVVAGFMETEMSSTLSQKERDKIYRRTALQLPTNIGSVAQTVEFLLSDGSKSITGQNIFVDAGTI
jgi:3-oxoacyl-[acyl-carrier protein] reductase